jgi:carbonic anhydrase
MSAIDEVVEANRRYAEGFTQGGLPGRPPSRKLAVVACMDCRLHVAKLLGLELGAAHIIRNAGGIVTEDVVRSLIVSHHIGGTQEFMIINNTKCGMLTFKDEELAARLQQESGKAPVAPGACQHSWHMKWLWLFNILLLAVPGPARDSGAPRLAS